MYREETVGNIAMMNRIGNVGLLHCKYVALEQRLPPVYYQFFLKVQPRDAVVYTTQLGTQSTGFLEST